MRPWNLHYQTDQATSSLSPSSPSPQTSGKSHPLFWSPFIHLPHLPLFILRHWNLSPGSFSVESLLIWSVGSIRQGRPSPLLHTSHVKSLPRDSVPPLSTNFFSTLFSSEDISCIVLQGTSPPFIQQIRPKTPEAALRPPSLHHTNSHSPPIFFSSSQKRLMSPHKRASHRSLPLPPQSSLPASTLALPKPPQRED